AATAAHQPDPAGGVHPVFRHADDLQVRVGTAGAGALLELPAGGGAGRDELPRLVHAVLHPGVPDLRADAVLPVPELRRAVPRRGRRLVAL
ncbi:MAG: hypothetical protein AVDCRST_MAG64-1608, partial [uncultured Phycisphaerae bacterium]